MMRASGEVTHRRRKEEVGAAPLVRILPIFEHYGWGWTLRAFVVDDNQESAERIEAALRLRWSNALVCRLESAMAAVRAAHEDEPDLVVLSLDLRTMDGLDGLDGLEAIRRFSTAPVVAIAPRDGLHWIRALELGADEYVVRPFSSLELIARVTAVLAGGGEMTGGHSPESFDDGVVTIDGSTSRAGVGGRSIPLTRPEMRLLGEMLRKRGVTVRCRSAQNHALGQVVEDGSAFLRVYVRRLREKLEADPDSPRYLLTEPGVGYRFGGRPWR
jgi:two-component system KDP operon response regulator KdpE